MYFLRIGDDILNDAVPYLTKSSAIEAYSKIARKLDRYGQKIDASIHIADSMSEVVEYPDYVLSLGPRGGVKVEKT